MARNLSPRSGHVLLHAWSVVKKTDVGSFLYADLNECENSEHNCHQLGICTNNFGSFSCHCMRGYTGNGTWCEGERELEKLTC